MASLLKYVWKRNTNADSQSGAGEPLAEDTVMDYRDAEESFTEVHVRPMTYAEAAGVLKRNNAPQSNVVAFVDATHSGPTRTVSHQPRPESLVRSSRRGPSRNVEINAEYDGEEFFTHRQRQRAHRRPARR